MVIAEKLSNLDSLLNINKVSLSTKPRVGNNNVEYK